MRYRDRTIEVWPVLTDLMAGVALLLTIALLSARRDVDKIRDNASALQTRVAALERDLQAAQSPKSDLLAKVRALEKQLADANATIAALQEQLADAKKAGAIVDRVGVPRELLRGVSDVLARKRIATHINEDTGTLLIPESLVFERGKADLPRGNDPRLAKILEIGATFVGLLEQNDSAQQIARIEVSGHTDKTGTFQRNLNLSRDRASSIVNAWIGRLADAGHKPCITGKLLPVGMGSARPLFEESDSDCNDPVNDPTTAEDESRGCAANRRIEITIVPKDPSRPEIKGCP